MHRARTGARIVDVATVDTDQTGAALGKQAGRRGRQERMILLIIGRSPEAVPTGVDEDCLAADSQAFERLDADATQEVDAAVAFAEAGTWEPASELMRDVTAASTSSAP